MGRFSDVLLVLAVLCVSTPGEAYWTRRPPGRPSPSQAGAHAALRMPPRLGSPLLKSRALPTRMSGRNKLFMDHLQLSLNREGAADKLPRGMGRSRKLPLHLRLGRLSPPLPLKPFTDSELPRIDFKGLKTFSSHQMKPLKNIRLAPFLPGFGSRGRSKNAPSQAHVEGHRKREQKNSNVRKARIENNPLIVTYDIKTKQSKSVREQHAREHSIRGRERQYATAEEYLANRPFSHLSPCNRQGRHKCLNGGICVYVESLDIQTCRCPAEYTGRRCEEVDQEYLVSLYSDSVYDS